MTHSRRSIMGVQGSEANETADVKGTVLVYARVCVCVWQAGVSKSVYRPVLISLQNHSTYCTSFCGSLWGRKLFSEADISLWKQHATGYVSFQSAISPTVWCKSLSLKDNLTKNTDTVSTALSTFAKTFAYCKHTRKSHFYNILHLWTSLSCASKYFPQHLSLSEHFIITCPESKAKLLDGNNDHPLPKI